MSLLPLFLTVAAAFGGTWSETANDFQLGPIPPTVDLRAMLRENIVRRSCAALDACAMRRKEAFDGGTWEAWRDAVRQAVLDGMAPMPFGDAGGPLNVRLVSRIERDHYIVENVLFESFPGDDVNASVYLPRAEAFPPPWPAIVTPVGHSDKTGKSYQEPAQVFAQCGYVALTFDPPGAGGEKRPGNDHFMDGVRCYLTGHSSNRYFVIDALRCVDYLVSRTDVDARNGVAMTGVSGGGLTTLYAAMLDDRIAVIGPSCCAVPAAMHPVLDGYAECPEPMAPGRFALYDTPDLLAAAAPRPVMLMAGAEDEVFNETMSRAIADDVRACFEKAGNGERFSFFLDPGGHAYTPAMALEFVRWTDRWMRGIPDRRLPDGIADRLEMLPTESLACHPRTDRNMVSINADYATALRAARAASAAPLADRVRAVVHAAADMPVPEARVRPPALVWRHFVQELLLTPEAGIELPATFLYPSAPGWRGDVLVFFDDRGRWTGLRSQGPLAAFSQFIADAPEGPAIFAVDLRGWGDSTPADMRYDLAGWGARERWISYLSAALGDAALAMRVRDGLGAVRYAQSRTETARVLVGGCGMGAAVALHVATMVPEAAGVILLDGLGSFEALAAAENYAWPADAFLPGVLTQFDLPELAAGLVMPCVVVNPLDAAREPLEARTARKLYPEPVRVVAGGSWEKGFGELREILGGKK